MNTNETREHARRFNVPWKLIVGLALGGTAGFLYYYFVGCASGTCPITSNPYGSVLYGAVMGALIARM